VTRRCGFLLLGVLCFAAQLGASSWPNGLRVQSVGKRDLEKTAETLWKRLAHNARFQGMARSTARLQCAALAEPVALATPDPILERGGDLKITISFVVGTDGHVYSPLILAGVADDDAGREVLDAVKAWRYRPARCNGAPTEAEAKVEFSSN
jgi:TonB family protein